MDRTVTRDNLGAWLLRCNPRDKWDLAGFMDNGGEWIGAWSVVDTYRSQMMAPDDLVVLWVTGDSRILARGIWGIGYVTSEMKDEAPDDPQAGEIDFWVDDAARRAVEHMVDIDIPLFDDAITASEIRAAGLDDLEVLRQTQGQNPSWITKEQLVRLRTILPPWPEPLEPAEVITVAGGGAGFGDPLQNSIVEAAGMAAVIEYYGASDWVVDDVSGDKVGWDLTCTSPQGRRVLVEVKGVRGTQPIVLLTANEIRAANNEPEWYLAVVTRALSGPTVTEYDAAAAAAAAKPYVYKANLG